MELQNPNLTDEVPEPALEATSEVVDEGAMSSVEETAEETLAALAVDSDAETEHAPSASEPVDDSDEDDTGEDEADTPGIKRGDILDGTVLETSTTEIRVDLGEGMIGIVPNRELQYLSSDIITQLEVGKPVTVYVVKPRRDTGQPILSISRALEELDWREAEAYATSKRVYEGNIAGYNKGGLIVRFGRLRGFIPASQISQERNQRAQGDSPDQRWGEMLNETIVVKVVEVNRTRNRLILSERAASRESRERQKERLIEELRVGDIRKGRVISLTDFGAFVDLGGADGLIHLTELSWKHVNHPRELLSVGDEVEVKVISVDPARKRIGLSLKSLESDPWTEIMRGYKENQLVQGKITKLTRFGAFASLVDNVDVEGLIHVSELADYRVEHPRDVVAVGDVLTLRVLKIDVERRRLGLSLKRVNSAKYMNSDWDSWAPGEE
jgi:small subunit ribosomal protein S1